MTPPPRRSAQEAVTSIAVSLVLATRDLDDAARRLGEVLDDLRDELGRDPASGGDPQLEALPGLNAEVTELTVRVRTLRAGLRGR